jgi:hypothetical protein
MRIGWRVTVTVTVTVTALHHASHPTRRPSEFMYESGEAGYRLTWHFNFAINASRASWNTSPQLFLSDPRAIRLAHNKTHSTRPTGSIQLFSFRDLSRSPPWRQSSPLNQSTR